MTWDVSGNDVIDEVARHDSAQVRGEFADLVALLRVDPYGNAQLDTVVRPYAVEEAGFPPGFLFTATFDEALLLYAVRGSRVELLDVFWGRDW